LCEGTVEISTACYAGMLALQSIGLGGWLYGGISPLSILGASGDPAVPGLGFHFETDQRWPLPNVTGLPGVFEGHCPPHYSDIRDAVEAVINKKFGSGGPYNSQTPGPYKENPRVRGAAAKHGSQFRDCVTTMAQYTYDQFGKLPATIPSIFAFLYLQAHHLDLEFYDKHFGPGAYLETHANHMECWHSGR
ncbi:MAG: hypothetical protein GY953_54870, partial [bacterium]|nr:hypothetical protein [bacterium]